METNECKVYVGNLPFSVGFKELKEIFSHCGKVIDSTVIVNKFSGRSKGFGFVTFESKKEAEKAIAEMNEKEVNGRRLRVRAAIPFEEKRAERSPIAN
jgi:RNA recognition motif-containing protein